MEHQEILDKVIVRLKKAKYLGKHYESGLGAKVGSVYYWFEDDLKIQFPLNGYGYKIHFRGDNILNIPSNLRDSDYKDIPNSEYELLSKIIKQAIEQKKKNAIEEL